MDRDSRIVFSANEDTVRSLMRGMDLPDNIPSMMRKNASRSLNSVEITVPNDGHSLRRATITLIFKNPDFSVIAHHGVAMKHENGRWAIVREDHDLCLRAAVRAIDPLVWGILSA